MFGKLVLHAGMSAIVASPCAVFCWISNVKAVDENDPAFLLKPIRIQPVNQAVAFIVAATAVDDLAAIALDVVPQTCRFPFNAVGLAPAAEVSLRAVVGVLEVSHSS